MIPASQASRRTAAGESSLPSGSTPGADAGGELVVVDGDDQLGPLPTGGG